jgi:bisphosphoglycerate-independent phosphoglycerate mutase (AlkP superfamily)
LEQHVKAGTEQHQVAGKGIFLSKQGMGKADKERQPAPHLLHGSSLVAGGSDMQIENSEIGTTNVGAVEVIQQAATTKMCRRCGV